MEVSQAFFSNQSTRLGFHYYPDTLHYQQSDLRTWLPQLKALNTSWLILKSETRRAIPEFFISELVQSGIEPIIQFNLNLERPPHNADLSLLLKAYKNWGVNGVLLTKRPNIHASWNAVNWANKDLIQHFLAHFLPLANLTIDHGLLPFMPPLEPGGNYWDTSFLRAMLQNLTDTGNYALLNQLVLTAYAWTNHHSLNWGAGGAKQWPLSRPYLLPPGQEDHRGFRVFEWYQAICQEVLGQSCPIFLLQAGIPQDPMLHYANFNLDQHTDMNMSIIRLLMGEKIPTPENPKTLLHAIDESVVSCNFWLLAADKTSPFAKDAWFQTDGSQKPIVQDLKIYFQKFNRKATEQLGEMTEIPEIKSSHTTLPNASGQPVAHYLLLPPMEPKKVEALLNSVEPFIHQFHPNIGFSMKEAVSASHVSLIGDPDQYPDNTIANLSAAGCKIQHLAWDGTFFAT